MSTHRIAAPVVLTPVILLCLTACGGDASSEATPEATAEATPEATDEATDVPEGKTLTISGTYAEPVGDSRSQKCVSGEDQIIVKSGATLSVVAIGNTSAEGKFDKQTKACLYKFIVRDVPVSNRGYGMQVGTAEDIAFARGDAEGLFITSTAP